VDVCDHKSIDLPVMRGFLRLPVEEGVSHLSAAAPAEQDHFISTVTLEFANVTRELDACFDVVEIVLKPPRAHELEVRRLRGNQRPGQVDTPDIAVFALAVAELDVATIESSPRSRCKQTAMNPRIVMTGGPGAGKSTLLGALAARGYGAVPDSARALIVERKARGLPQRLGPSEFAHEILRMDVDRYLRARAESGRVFFERGIVDALGMLDELGLLAREDVDRYLAEYPYHPVVFVLPPWERIYRTDDERDQTFAESVRIYGLIRRWYVRCGYELVTVPRVAVAERCAFVLHALERFAGRT
jgi:predicted ATPase